MALIEQQLALLDQLEKANSKSLADVLQAAAISMAVQFRQTRLPNMPAISALPSINTELRKIWTAAIAGSTEIFMAEFAEGFPQSKATPIQIIETFIAAYRQGAAQQILDTTQRQVRALMAGGLAAGQSADAVYSELLEKMPEISSIRSLLITRTEVHAATQFASWQLARRSVIPLVKVWNATPDDKTRDFGQLGKISQFNHRVMDGKKVGINAPFSIPRIVGGFEQLMFPGDPHGSAGNIINCRCIQTYERA
jgi:hypothetical protein